jgi:hypothetical protein
LGLFACQDSSRPRCPLKERGPQQTVVPSVECLPCRVDQTQPPEIDYRRPAWIQPPEDVVPGIVPVELVLANIPQRAISLTDIRA